MLKPMETKIRRQEGMFNALIVCDVCILYIYIYLSNHDNFQRCITINYTIQVLYNTMAERGLKNLMLFF